METPHLPSISVMFKQLAETIIARSTRGVGFLVVKDDTEGNKAQEIKASTYKSLKEEYIAGNAQYIKDMLDAGIYKLFVIKMNGEDTIDDVWKTITGLYSSGRIVLADGTEAEYKELVDIAKLQNKYHVVTYKLTGSDCMYVENFMTEKVTFADDRGEVEGIKFLPALAAILCICNINRSATYYVCDLLSSCQEAGKSEDEINEVVGKGNIVLINDVYNGVNSVRIGEGVNTMTTTKDEYHTADMKYIDIVEAMDLIREDIVQTFKASFVGGKKNGTDNQMLFFAAVNGYFRKLCKPENGEVLEATYNNIAEIDVNEQRKAWETEKPEAAEWDDNKVRNMPYHRDVFALADIKINGAMENLKMKINMN